MNPPSPLIDAPGAAAALGLDPATGASGVSPATAAPGVNPVTATAGASPPESAPTVLDVRWRLAGPPGRDDYLTAHVPGAVFVDLDSQLCGPPGPAGRHPLPDPAAFEAAMRAAGVRHDRPVIAYDDGDGMAAARLWWTLSWAGHPDVRVLDGGWAAWRAAGLPEQTEVPAPEEGDFHAVPGNLKVLEADEAAAFARRGALLDARVGARYRGETEPIDPVAGHIPGARNVPHGDLVAEGRLRVVDELRARFEAEIAGDGPVGAYCGSGVTAAHTVLALTVAGYPQPALYVGSWSNWVADPARPVATGDER